MMASCPTKDRGHNGDSQCSRSGWPVVRGQVCFRCKNHPPEVIAPPARSQISATGGAMGLPGGNVTTLALGDDPA